MRAILLLSLFFSSLPAFADTKLIQLSSDKTTYAAGETAVLRAMLLSEPENTDFEFEALGQLNGADLPMDRITQFESFANVANLQAGAYTWTVNIYLQDARLARDLKASIDFYNGKIANIDAELVTNPPPERVAELEADKAEDQSLITAAQNQLTANRTFVHGPETISFTVQ